MTRIQSLYKQIRTVLLTDWDPIGIRDVPQASDEYDAYVAPVAKMLAAGKSSSELSKYLTGIEIDAMGLAGDPARARSVADKLLRLADRG